MEQQEMIRILDRYLAGTATEAEQQHIEDWLDSNANDDNEWQRMDENKRTNHLASLYQQILSTVNQSSGQVYMMGTKTKRRRMMWRLAAAASIIAIVSVTAIIFFTNKSLSKPPIAITPADIKAPESNRAVITLADGSRIYLDSARTGTLVMQQDVNLIKNEKGEIVYQTSDNGAQNGVTHNSLFNPRGSKVITLALSDGTKVWLNSESSLRYPTAFTGKTREVEITGEAYFEVSHNAEKPFYVKRGAVNVQVLGTHFNVNAYEDEEVIKVTLLEGLVEVKSKNEKVKIRPGEQATITSDFKLQTSNHIDLAEVIAWKEGQFIYTNTDLSTIMRQMARWYDVEVVYQDKITDKYTVNVSRDVPVSKLFQFIEMSGGVRFEIEGKKVIVKK